MNLAQRLFPSVFAALLGLAVSSCQHQGMSATPIALKGFSDENYEALEAHKGSKVCVNGILSIDSVGVYYPLQPIERDDSIDVGFSRIEAGISRQTALGKGFVDGGRHTVCGKVEDATPFRKCNTAYCKWYSLAEAKPR